MRWRSRSKPARPYICRFSSLRRVIWPSAWPLLQGVARPCQGAAAGADAGGRGIAAPRRPPDPEALPERSSPPPRRWQRSWATCRWPWPRPAPTWPLPERASPATCVCSGTAARPTSPTTGRAPTTRPATSRPGGSRSTRPHPPAPPRAPSWSCWRSSPPTRSRPKCWGPIQSALPDGLQQERARDAAIAALHRYSLIGADAGRLTIHRLVQAVTRDGLDEATAKVRAETAVRLLAWTMPFRAGYPSEYPKLKSCCRTCSWRPSCRTARGWPRGGGRGPEPDSAPPPSPRGLGQGRAALPARARDPGQEPVAGPSVLGSRSRELRQASRPARPEVMNRGDPSRSGQAQAPPPSARSAAAARWATSSIPSPAAAPRSRARLHLGPKRRCGIRKSSQVIVQGREINRNFTQ